MEHSPRQSNFTTDRPVGVLMVFLAAVVFGYFSLGRLPVTLMPEMTYPTLTVRTEYPGSAPEEVENDISRPVEEQLGVISGLREISSISRAGVSDVVLEFVWGTSMVEAIQNTLEKLDNVYLPREAEKPLLLHYDPSLDPVMELSLSMPETREGAPDTADDASRESAINAGARRLRRIAELQVKRALEPITGVAAARVRGGLEEEIHVLVDAGKLQRLNLSFRQVLDRLRAENINAAGGRIREGAAEYMIRTINEYQNLEEIANTVIFREDGHELRLKDVGVVVHGERDREMLTHTEGGESVQIDVYKEADSNMVLVAERIKKAVGSKNGSPKTTIAGKLFREEGVVLQVVADRSIFIDSSIEEVKSTAVLGGLLAIAVLLLFLRDLRTTAIIAVSIPVSILTTFAPLQLLGVSLNIMSLGGMAMGIGMLVDSSIVVLESIFRCRAEGDSVREAAIRGTREVRGAVTASTLTSICVFFPMVFVSGLAGQVFNDLGLTVVTTLIASLIVAIWLIPMLASRTGFKLRGGVGVSHPLAILRTHLRPTTWLLRVVLPMAGWLIVLVGAALGYAELRPEVDNPDSKKKVMEPAALAFAALRFGAIFCAVPLLVALVKIRSKPVDPVGEKLTSLWGSFGSFRDSLQGHRAWWLLKLPYLVPRLALSFLLELVGLSLIWTIRFVARVGLGIARLVGQLRRFVPERKEHDDTARERGIYPRALRWALAHPTAMLAVAIACLALTYTVGRQLQSELLPEVHQGEFTFEVSLPVGTPLEETVAALSPVEQALLERQGDLPIETLLVTYGFDASNRTRSDEGEHSAKFKFLLEESQHAEEIEQLVIEEVRKLFRSVPDIDSRVTRPVLFSAKKPIVVQINGENLDELKNVSDQATALLEGSSELADVEPTLRSGAPEVEIRYDRQQIIRHGLNIENVALQVRDMVKGAEATRLNRRDRRVPIVVRLAKQDRQQVADVGELIVNPGAVKPLPLRSIAELAVGEGPNEIRRIDGKRVTLVEANIGGNALGAAVSSARSLLETEVEWPGYMDFEITGQNREWERSRGSLYLALGLSLFLVYVVMASQFESLVQPLVIMLTIPLAFLGTVLGLKALGMNLSVVVFLGMIMLAGIVVNNAIVLVDYTNTLRGRGIPLVDAIVQAGRVRLRPILMTTATTVLGLLPMALGIGNGAEIRTPMAITVTCGLLTSTLLTLLIVPTMYYLFALASTRLVGDSNEAN